MAKFTDWSARGRGSHLGNERLIEQFLDSKKQRGEKFFLYYFMSDFTDSKSDPAKSTILFISGGPGELNRFRYDNFGDIAGYRIVYFHVRGAGFSQIPANREYDKYLRAKYVVEDIEKIREELLGKNGKWRGIVGHSYGTVLAQQYAHKYPNNVDKIVLSAPLSRHNLEQIPEAPRVTETLERIYESKRFAFLADMELPDGTRDIRPRLLKKVQKISNIADEQFGSIQFLVDEYDGLKIELGDKFPAEVKPYSRAFFAALRRLRNVGWLNHSGDLVKGLSDNVDEVQQYTGLIIADEILTGLTGDYAEKFNQQAWTQFQFGSPVPARGSNKNPLKKVLGNARSYFEGGRQNSQRAYYVLTLYDGVNAEFLREYKSSRDMQKAIDKMGGRQHEKYRVNQYLETVGIEAEGIKEWDPEQFTHPVTTLILKGGADPVSQGDQAEHYFHKALLGDRLLIEFPGIGHSMALPEMARAVARRQTRDFLLSSFLAQDFDELRRSNVIDVVRGAFKRVKREEPNRRYNLEVKAKWASRTDKTTQLLRSRVNRPKEKILTTG
jgi:pimeloyl-ACP methyl ester carboxylesterase